MNKKRFVAAAISAASMPSLISAPMAMAEAVIETPVTVENGETVAYDEVANVAGTFSFEQDMLTPSDKVFSLFGTAATAMCAKPGFALGNAQVQDHYITINGGMEKIATISLDQIKENGKVEIMTCSCGMSASVANTSVTGMYLSDIIEMADLDESINTVTVKSTDGYGKALPLKLAVENGAMLVYAVGGEGLTPENGGPVQLWMPGVVASYFTRQVASIELTAEEEAPEVTGPKDEFRAKVSFVNAFDGQTFKVGDQLCFEGYADDCGVAIKAVEFSMDGGKTWTSYSTEGCCAEKWVYWHFAHVPETAGSYKLDVRAVTADGTVSPLSSSVVFTVE